MEEVVVNSYYLWFMQQSSYTSGRQLWEDETVCIFIPESDPLDVDCENLTVWGIEPFREIHYVRFVQINMKA